jgi:7-carboxy-7-deazaguanine synthase
MKDYLFVAEAFYSIQGEGQTAGTPAVFLRLAGCNLMCDHKWRCDTIEVWQHGEKKPFPEVLGKELTLELAKGANLVITGGEPLLQQEQIVSFLYWMANTMSVRPKVEIETNGTVMPNNDMRALISYWNISPKLSNSGEPANKRINEAALLEFYRLSYFRAVCYKFVVADNGDVQEMINDFDTLVNFEKVWLMPAGATREELLPVRPVVVEICKQLHFNYSERLHIGIWDKKTGV